MMFLCIMHWIRCLFTYLVTCLKERNLFLFSFLLACLLTYLPTCLLTFFLSCLLTYFLSLLVYFLYLLVYLLPYILTYVFLLSFLLLAYLIACLIVYFLSFLLTCLLTFLGVYLFTYSPKMTEVMQDNSGCIKVFIFSWLNVRRLCAEHYRVFTLLCKMACLKCWSSSSGRWIFTWCSGRIRSVKVCGMRSRAAGDRVERPQCAGQTVSVHARYVITTV